MWTDGYVPATSFYDYPFYGALSVAYLLFGLLWLVACTLHSDELIKLQHLITGGLALGMIETALLYSHYHSWNEHGTVSMSLLSLGGCAFLFFLQLQLPFVIISLLSRVYSSCPFSHVCIRHVPSLTCVFVMSLLSRVYSSCPFSHVCIRHVPSLTCVFVMSLLSRVYSSYPSSHVCIRHIPPLTCVFVMSLLSRVYSSCPSSHVCIRHIPSLTCVFVMSLLSRVYSSYPFSHVCIRHVPSLTCVFVISLLCTTYCVRTYCGSLKASGLSSCRAGL
jgi:hypothetical protein